MRRPVSYDDPFTPVMLEIAVISTAALSLLAVVLHALGV